MSRAPASVRRKTVIVGIGLLLFIAPACSDLFTRTCEQGHFVGLLLPEGTAYPVVLKVGASLGVTSNYGTGQGNQGENCDHVLYTSVERPERFQFFSSDPGVATVSPAGNIKAIAPGTTSVYAISNGVTGRKETITVVP